MRSTIDLLGRRWMLRIIWELSSSPAGFREMQRRCGNMSSSVLSSRLTELIGARLITGDAGRYRLTPLGEELVRALQPLREWNAKWEDELHA
ncbi:winged helix-turn-helix transcriptional regulator [Amycolatopsis sacchari]|uniref:winged helix-turn-helix transcriptional regulator n=1 Tax=Amycolatopsis sacchari TaxID=115433 RepID=UPI003EC018C1